jgi:predicted transcriptional regulator
MRSGCCGAIPVVDASGRVVGMITDRDITMELVRSTRKPINIAAHEIMSHSVYTCRPDEDVRVALRAMKEYRVHRLPVTDFDNRLRGILSMDDIILRALAPDAPSTDDILNSLREIVMRMSADAELETDGRLLSLGG